IDNNYKDACYSLKTTVTSEPSQKDKLQSLHSLQNLGLKKISPGSDKCKLEPNKNKEINEDNKRM
ncbi:MAG: hypothetical protein ACKPKR_09630, partial [Microcystis panniformis]